MAIKLNLPGADKNGHHEENQLMVQKWLKLTEKRWLMVFDNADRESEKILKGYWPIGAEGAILITSRDYYNFMKDVHRKGETILPFNSEDSWELMLQLLDEKWRTAYNNGTLAVSEVIAAKSWLAELGGLPLSIQTATSLINNSKISGNDIIAQKYETFKVHKAKLPPRHRADRSPLILALDAVFDMTFTVLSKHARDVLSVLALLSPDEILIELFLPRNQAALNGKLSFAKQDESSFIAGSTQAKLSGIVKITPDLAEALEELKAANLIRWEEHRVIAVHREIQEAMNYSDRQDLQESFTSAVHLVFEAFPKQKGGNTLYEEWQNCEHFITHAVHLSRKFLLFQGTGKLIDPKESKLKITNEFIDLLANATWFLYEVGDYETSREVVDIAADACEDKNSSRFANLCNTQGCNYYDLNRMANCRRDWETALRIRESLQEDETKNDVAIMLNNLGNLETATGHYEEALLYFDRCVTIRKAQGDEVAPQLGTTYLNIGRCHSLNKKFREARMMFGQAEQLFLRTPASDPHFMASCHYAYGNVELEEGLYDNARRSFDNCLNIAAAEIPVHPLTCAAYYSLGCVEFASKNNEPAKGYFSKARSIAELRSPSRDDGTVARILWKTAQVLLDDVSGEGNEEAQQLLDRANLAKAKLVASGESADSEMFEITDDDSRPQVEIDEDSFDRLVPGLFR